MRTSLIVFAVLTAAIWMTPPLPAEALPFVGAPCPLGPSCPTPLFGTLINFDDLPTGVVVPMANYLGLGVTSITNIHANGAPLLTFPSTQSAPNYVGTGPVFEWDATILVEFAGTTSMVGIGVARVSEEDIADSLIGPLQGVEVLTIFDASMTVLETADIVPGSSVYQGFARASADIKFLRIDCDFCAVDDLQFLPVKVVSEPSTLLLLGTALMPLSVLRKRRPGGRPHARAQAVSDRPARARHRSIRRNDSVGG